LSAPDPARFAELTDPVAVRLSRRVLEGHIHMLEAQIARLLELARTLEDREADLLRSEPPHQENDPAPPKERTGS
jgi:hypothetical protein